MFLGNYSPKLDDKGRLFLPAKFREAMAEGIVITKGQERCLYVFTRADFAVLAAERAKAPLTDKDAREYNRLLSASAFDDVPDKQGRISVPFPLRSYAGLTKECTVLGALTRLEIWDSAAWTTYEAAKDAAFADRDEGAQVS